MYSNSEATLLDLVWCVGGDLVFAIFRRERKGESKTDPKSLRSALRRASDRQSIPRLATMLTRFVSQFHFSLSNVPDHVRELRGNGVVFIHVLSYDFVQLVLKFLILGRAVWINPLFYGHEYPFLEFRVHF